MPSLTEYAQGFPELAGDNPVFTKKKISAEKRKFKRKRAKETRRKNRNKK
jgi:hypothetical protein